MVEVVEIVELAIRLELIREETAIDPGASFSANGIDSLDVMTLLLSIEERYGVKFTDIEASEMRSIYDLAQSLNKRPDVRLK